MTDSHKTEIVHAPAAGMAPADRAIHPLIAQLADGRIDPATIGKMMDLQERHEANEARKAYQRALNALKAVLPKVIAKDGKVDYTPQGKDRVFYRHATLAGVMDAVTEHLTAHGFSVSWVPARLANGHVQVTCRLTHCEGHSESCALDATVDGSGGKNSIQAVGSTVSYLERYTILSLLGLATGDMPTGEERQAEGPKVDPARNLAAVGELRKRGVDLDAVIAKVGRPVDQWTTADLDVVRAMLPRKPRENPDGSVDVDPPRSP